MIHDSTTLFGRPAIATDGAFGYVTDFYVDSSYWQIRYAVVKTDAWLDGRLALVATQCFLPDPFDHPSRPMVNLTREKIAHFDTAGQNHTSVPPPPSTFASSHFLPSHWESSGMGDRSHGTAILSAGSFHHNALHSVKSLAGFQLETSNGAFGKLEGLALDTSRWTAAEFLFGTRQWFRHSQVHLPAASVESVDTVNRAVRTKLSRTDVANMYHLVQCRNTIPAGAGTV